MKAVCKYIALLFCVLIFQNTKAQLSLFDSLAYQYRVGINGTVALGNIERLLLRTSGEFARIGKIFAFKSTHTYTYGTILRNKTEDDLTSANFLYYKPFAKISPYAKLWVESNFRHQKNYAYQTGLGLTYTPISQKNHTLKLSANISFEESDFKSNNFVSPFAENSLYESKRVQVWRYLGRIYGRSKLLENKLIWYYDAWLQPAIEDFENQRFRFFTSLNLRIHKHFYLQTTFNYTRESLIIEGIKNYDGFGTIGFLWGNF